MPDLIQHAAITTTGAIVGAWALVQFVTKPWIDRYFDAQKQALQDTYARQFAALEHGFKLLMDRASRLHEHEYAVLPELWRKTSSALTAIVDATDPARVPPSVREMQIGELDAFLSGVQLADWEKWQIRDHLRDHPERGDERERKLADMLDWAAYRHAQALAEEFRSYLVAQSIFISADLRSRLAEIAQRLAEALSEYRHYLEERRQNRGASLDQGRGLRDEWTRMAEAVRIELQQRLRTGEEATPQTADMQSS